MVVMPIATIAMVVLMIIVHKNILKYNWFKSDKFKRMTHSKLQKMNEDIQQRTKYFVQYGKYGSKWDQQSFNSFNNSSRLTNPQKCPTNSRTSYEFLDKRIKEQQNNRIQTENLKTYQFVTPQYQHYYYKSKLHIQGKAQQSVSNQSYQFLSNIRQQSEKIEAKPKQQNKQTFRQFYDIVDGAHEQKQIVQDLGKQARKTGSSKFNFMKYITTLMEQLRKNLLGGSKPEISAKYKFKDPRQIQTQQNIEKPKQVLKSECFHEVSPILYSKKFITPSDSEIESAWNYILIAIGIFLVIFQILK